MASEEFNCSSDAAKGFLERSIPVILAWSAKASIINWTLEMEDAA